MAVNCFILCAALLLICSSAALCQNNDLALLYGGGIETETTADGTARSSASIGGSTQINYSRRLLRTPSGRLFVEFPLVTIGDMETEAGRDARTSATGAALFVPGLRYKFALNPRLSPYIAAGIGVGGVESVSVDAAGARVSTRVETTPVFGFGGGLDLRVTGVISLRAEVRDFVTQRVSDVKGRNHVVFAVGVGFHF